MSTEIIAARPETPPFQLRRDATRNFVGRELELKELEHQLHQAGTLAITAIKGMGGIGKTELALQYAIAARKLEKYPSGICWIDVRGKDVVDEILDFANNYLDFLPPDNQTPEKQVELCWNRWSELFKQEKLLILDDVADYTQIYDYLPPYNPSLKVIITTRLRLESVNIQSLILEVLKDIDALNLLKAFIGEERVEHELEQAQELCQWVGNLPLGLTLVGRYLREFPEDSLEELLEKLKEEGLDQDSLQETEIPIGDNKTTANLWRGERRLYENVYAVFNLNWKYLQKEGKQLGAILSLFDAPPYTWSLVEKAAKPLSEQRGKAKINLKDLHLIHENEGSPIHPIIQEFFLKKLKENGDFLNIQDILFDNFVFQQYVYDTGYIENNLKQIEKVREFISENNAKGYVILSKMIGHGYYADRTHYMKQSVENMMIVQEKAEAQSDSSSVDEQKVWLWYQLYCLDHTHNLVATTPEGNINIFDRKVTAQELQSKLELLLSDELKQLDTPPTSDVCPYILRAAHYWGHRGNQLSFRLFRDIVSQSKDELEKLHTQGIEYYARAAVFRLVNFRLSCPKEYQKHLKGLLQGAPYIPEWLPNWTPLGFQNKDINFERFTSASQALGDTAHQYRGIADVQLWSYLYLAPIGVHQSFLEETKRVIDITEELWKVAKALLKPNEKIIRYYIWIAQLETMLELVESHHSGEQLIAWEEAERRLIEDLDTLEEQYRLSYPWAREKSLERLQQFYKVLENVPLP
ncbi:MAG TPA: NB-ARC domain-containing protein [Stenomitos sp.]